MKAIISDELSDALADQQNRLAREEVPVLIIFEGASGRVISRIVNEVSRALEPRFISYCSVDADDPGSTAFAEIMKATPAKGEVVLMDRSWYAKIVNFYTGDIKLLERAAGQIRNFEDYLLDNGTRLIKIRLQITPSVMEKYADDYRPYTSLTGSFLAASKVDRVKFTEVMDELVPMTHTARAPWDVVKVGKVEDTVSTVVNVILDRFKETFNGKWRHPSKHKVDKCFPNPRDDIDHNEVINHFKRKMADLSAELERLQVLLSLSDRSMVLCFEGWDAAGKGGCIKHITHALNPRGYVVDRVKKPDATEYAHTHLWRFAKYIPAPGHIAVFDRTWYGRMMVEPIEGFCTEEEYSRSADEINMFEKSLADSGVIVLKFWLEITPEEQARRFQERKESPLKSWKFTEEDERNASKWDIYPKYIDAMISSTNTPYAPWFAFSSENKKVAQLKVMETIVEALKREIVI